MRTWKRDREVKVLGSVTDCVPFFCSLCKTALLGDREIEAAKRWGCCIACEIDFFETNRERWENEGWRPSVEEIECRVAERDAVFDISTRTAFVIS